MVEISIPFETIVEQCKTIGDLIKLEKEILENGNRK